jgi:hypothetical protein
MPIENDNIESWGSDDMQPDTRTAAEIHSDELRERLRSDGFAVEVVRHDASGKETERFLSPQLWLTAVNQEVSRCSGRSNCYAEVSLFVPGERGSEFTEAFAKVGALGVLGMPIAQRASHRDRK